MHHASYYTEGKRRERSSMIDQVMMKRTRTNDQNEGDLPRIMRQEENQGAVIAQPHPPPFLRIFCGEDLPKIVLL